MGNVVDGSHCVPARARDGGLCSSQRHPLHLYWRRRYIVVQLSERISRGRSSFETSRAERRGTTVANSRILDRPFPSGARNSPSIGFAAQESSSTLGDFTTNIEPVSRRPE
ncbi:hypothetical protein ASPCAL01568 [Aspergillus calidoustus]|uniref:Uncharacterized protein n=1 Tax=Aspergillus calidoustus TaxID=454130 RepID=A0A0U5FVA3_ASPCI|nr:hypothetical protein ASPCAL01568 [Aspergillus calidoustus]